MPDVEKLSLASADPLEDRVEQLKELFPEAFSEGKVDFEKLRLELGDDVDEGRERYGLSWAGKADAIRAIQIPSVATLVPDRAASVDFDTTENLMIEGDNLEVLKLLQKAYHGKVKTIYIDPPYNTGKDFIYPDNFREGLQGYLRYSGQVDDEGYKLSTNTETSGRYHSNWLSMMYPRLFLARNLLREDGVIFVSIDDHEVHNLRHLMDEIYGPENWLGTIVWKNATDNNPSQIAIEHEYILVYSREKASLAPTWRTPVSDVKELLLHIGEEFVRRLDDQAERQKAYSEWFRENKAQLWPMDRYKYIDDGGIYIGSQSVHNPGKEGYRYDVSHPVTGKPCKQPLMGYRFPGETMDRLLSENKVLFGKDHEKIIELKVYAREFMDKLPSLVTLDGRLGAYDLRTLFPEVPKVFTNPKPVKLLMELFSFVLNSGDIVLDFFAGSCPTAEAVFRLNAKDGGSRRFIVVQLPEPVDETTDVGKQAASMGLKTISQIGAERIRRAARSVESEQEADSATVDFGSRMHELTASNFKTWQPSTEDGEDLAEKVVLHADNLFEGADEEAVLYEIMLKAGWPLTSPIEKRALGGQTVYDVEDGRLFICLADPISEDCIHAMRDEKPKEVICLDHAFRGNDELLTNTDLEMKSHGVLRFRTV